MNFYERLAMLVDFFHLVVLVIMVGMAVGPFFALSSRYSRIFKYNRAVLITVGLAQIPFNFICPLTLLSAYLRGLSNPEFVKDNWIGGVPQPFIIRIFKSWFGFEVPDVVITISTVLLVALAIGMLSRPQRSYQRKEILRFEGMAAAFTVGALFISGLLLRTGLPPADDLPKIIFWCFSTLTLFVISASLLRGAYHVRREVP